MLWNDVAFAVFMVAAVASLGITLFLIGSNTLKVFAALSACLGLIYGVTDVCEDLLLARILRNPQKASQATVTLASWMTRVKLVSLTMSVTGGVAFVALTKVSDFARR